MKLTTVQIMNLFFYRKDVFAIQLNSGAYLPVRKNITIKDVQEHIEGTKTLGAYCLEKDNTIKWACVDLDGDNLIKMRKEAQDIYDLIELNEVVKGKMLEFSGRRGYHVWTFFSEPIPASFGQKMIRARLTTLGLGFYEVFPKQTELTGKGFGNLVKVPMALHKKSNRLSKVLLMEGEI